MSDCGLAHETEQKTIEPPEIARAMNCGLALVYKGLRAGEIPSKRVGRRYIIGRRRFFAWLNDADD